MKLQQNAATLLIGEDLKAVKVEFNEGGQLYSYLCAHDVAVDDTVIVRNFKDKLTTVKVVQVIEAADLPLDVDYEYKFIIDVVDTTKYDNIMEARKELVRGIERERRKSVLSQLKSTLGLAEDNKLSQLLVDAKAKL